MSRWLGNRTGIGATAADTRPLNTKAAASLHYDELFEFAPAGYLLVDAEGNIQLINRTGAAMLGWNADRLTGQPLLRWIVAADKVLLSTLQHRLRSHPRAPAASLVLRAINREGRTVHLRLECAPVVPAQFGCWCAIMIDVSDEQQSARRLRRLQSQLQQIARLNTAGEMASHLAHELNQPLGTIMLNCEAALRLLKAARDLDAEVSEAVSQARDAAAFASNIIRRVRGFLRNAEDPRDVCDLGALIEDVSKLLETEMHDCDISLQREIEPGLPVVSADAVQIEQVLLNLARNAIEAIGDPAANADRRITIRASREPEQRVRVSVQDTGSGLSSGQLRQLFTPFYTTKRDGMGLGLSLSRSIVEAHGGKLWAEADVGRGAVFSMILPAAGEVTCDD